ncbi:MAG TPA: cysteine desulfurase family protein [Actinomycetota bacterium]
MQTPTTLYLDYAATTPLSDATRSAMLPWLSDGFANASGLYAGAREARKAIDEAREAIATAVAARPEEIVFTSGGTEADNLAIKGAAWHGRDQGRDGIVMSAFEHHAVLDPADWMARSGFRVTRVPVTPDGIVDLDALRDAVDAKTAIVSVMWANNEVGTIQPVAEAAAIARDRGAVFHSDAVQALPWIPVGIHDADMISLAAHKCHGPKGVGALVVRRGTRLQPLLHGGGQERGVRSSTYNTPGIVGFADAVTAAMRDRDEAAVRVAALRDRLQESLVSRLGGVHVNAAGAPRLPNHLSVGIDGIESEPLLLLLDAAGVAASAGSACQSGASEPSYVLRAMGVADPLAAGVLRLTLGRPTTTDEVDRAVEAIVAAVGRLRG